MARVAVPITVLTLTGDAKPSASVTVKIRATNTNAVLYAAETGAATVSNPLTTDANGRVTAWVERGAYRADVTGSGITGYSENFDGAPAGDGTVDGTWLAATALPIGFVANFAADGDVAGGVWVACDGRALSRSTYAALFGISGTKYGAGDGSTTFNIPDLRGRVAMGAGTGTGGGASGAAATKPTGGAALTARTAGVWGGEETHTLTGAESGVAAHSHGITDASTNFIVIDGRGSPGAGNLALSGASVSRDVNGLAIQNATPANAASAHNTLPPYTVLTPIIRIA